jgi:(+)-abscisic acid 8'-hydroxylase
MVTSVETAIEVAILAFLVWPIVRLLLTPAFVGRLGGSPELAMAIGAALVAYVVTVAAAAVLVPWLLRPAAVAAIALMLFSWWRARPGYGRDRGLPPGSLALAPIGPWVDDRFYGKQAARYGPVFKTNHVVLPTVCVVGLRTGIELLRQHDAVLDTPPARFSGYIDQGFVRYMPPEEHAEYWRAMRKGVTGAILREAEPDISTIVRRELAQPGPTGATTDRIASVVLLRLLFGIPPDHPDMERVVALYRVIDPRRAWRSRRRRVLAAIEETEAIIRGRGPGGFFRAALEAGDDTVDERVLLRNFVLLNHTAGGDLGGLLAWIVRMLTDHPAWVERVRADERPSGLARRIAQETLRLEQSEFLTRRATEDIHWDGYLIPKGWRLRICVRESHRSPAVFADPDVFDPDRFVPTPPSRDDYSPFGVTSTRTSCLGEPLTLTVGRIFVEELVRFDWSVVNDGPREFSGFHWRPSRRFRVALAAR